MADPETPAAPASAAAPAAAAAAAAPAATPAAPAAAPSGNPLLDAARAAPAALAAAADPAKPAAAAAADPEKPAAPAAPYAPEGLPEELRGATEKETIDKLWAAEQARKPPAAATDYKFDVTRELEGIVDPANDRVLPIWREVAHKHDLSQAQFQAIVGDLFVGMEKAGLIERGVNIASEFEALGAGAGDKAAQLQKGQTRVLELADKIGGIATRQGWSKEESSALIRSLDNRTSVQAVEKLLAMIPGEHGVQPGGKPGGDGVNLEDPAVRARLMYPNSQPRKVS